MSFFCHHFGVNSVQAAGIIIEYNPLHGGHLRLLTELRRRLGADAAVIGVMSGDFVQRGDFAILRRQARAKAAVESGVDLVLELPLPWAVASAERFADGSIQVLSGTGLVTDLVFGSECGDCGILMQAAQALLCPELDLRIRAELFQKDSYAAARQRALASLIGPEPAAVLAAPNNILGVEYCKALLRQNSPIRPVTVRRIGAGYHETEHNGTLPSATLIRKLLREGNRQQALDLMAPAMVAAYAEEEAAGRAPVFMETCERAVLARLRSMTPADFSALDQGREGLGNRLYEASREAASLQAILEKAKTRRYAYTRLRRMVLWAYLGLTASELPAAVPYLRVLACNAVGRSLLVRMRKTASIPLLTKPADVRLLGAEARRLFTMEAHAADLYALAYPDLSAASGGQLWREHPVIR